MNVTRHRCLALFLLFVLVLAPAPSARAQTGFHIGPSGGEVVAAFIGAGAVIGVGVYLIARHPRVTGCVAPDANGLELRTEGDQPRTYALTGKTADLKAGDRIKISGKRHKDHSGNRSFQVESLKRDFGACPAASARP